MKFSTKGLVLMALMVLAAGVALMLHPTISLADERPPIHLQSMVPKAFGQWREDPQIFAQVVNPQQQKMLNATYSETLSRTYVNSDGYRIMLSIAYGKNQSDALQLHRPEACYPAQGFILQSKKLGQFDLLGKPIDSTFLTTSMEQRFEPITYWTVVGDKVTRLGIPKKLQEIRYALHNRIPDGMLVRMSSIDRNSDNAFVLHEQFANAMIAAIAPENRVRFAGANGAP